MNRAVDAVVILSGGLDSTTVLYHLKSQGHEVKALSVDYGQRHSRELAAARGPVWDSLFLVDMIQHHTGALGMVKTLFASPRGGQEPMIFGYATGVDNDQRAEIDRMQQMLTTLPRNSPR